MQWSLKVTYAPITMVLLFLAVPCAKADTINSVLGVDVESYIILYEGGGTGNHLAINNFGTTGIWTGDLGIAGNGLLASTGPGTLNGNINFAAAKNLQHPQASISNTTINGTVNYSVANVQTIMNDLNTLSENLGNVAASGASVAIDTNTPTGHTQTIPASAGTPGMINGVNYRLFNVTSVTTNNGQNLYIQGDGSASVVFDVNTPSAANFHGNIYLEDLGGRLFGTAGYSGLTPDQVLFNLYQGADLIGGDTLSANDNGNDAHPANEIYGAFLDPNGTVSFVNTRFEGRIFGGDTHDMQIVSGDTITLPPGNFNHNTVPAPHSVVSLLGLGLMGFFAIGWRRRLVGHS